MPNITRVLAADGTVGCAQGQLRAVIVFVGVLLFGVATGYGCTYSEFVCNTHVRLRLEDATCKFTGSSTPYYVFRIQAHPELEIDVFNSASLFRPALALYRGSYTDPLLYVQNPQITELQHTFTDSDTYWLVAFAGDSAPSGSFLLDMYCSDFCVAPSVTSRSQDITLPIGGTTNLAVLASGTQPMHYRWYNAADPLNTIGNDSATIVTPPLQYTSQIRVDVTNACGHQDVLAAVLRVATTPPPPSGSCTPDARTLCLSANRFAVTVSWRDFSNNTGAGTAVSMTSDTGYFWFFNNTNVELVIKILDARTVNGMYWVFYGALSNVEYTITIRDTQTGRTKTYFNTSGNFASIGDTSALTP